MAIAPIADNCIFEYYAKIQSGEIIAGKWIKLLYQKITAALISGELRFAPKLAARAIKFIENFCHHHEGELAPGLIRLELWQKALISLIFGIVDDDGLRQFREVFIVIARKNGKTLLAAAIAAYCAFADGEYGARQYMAAPKLEQSEICYAAFYQTILAEPEMKKLCRKRRSDIYIPSTNGTTKPLAFSAKKSDGLNISLGICDEIASWNAVQGQRFYEVLRSSFGSRRQPLLISISTAGYIDDGPYDVLMARSTAWLNGNSAEKRFLPVLYIIDDESKWDDIDELKKSNPNMGVSVREEFFTEEIAIAKASLPKKAEYLTKYCNIKQNNTVSWLPYDIVSSACGDDIKLEDFGGCYCVAGIDLSQTTDLTAAAAVIEKNELLYAIVQFFMPRAKIAELQEREGVPYDIYIKQGLITPSGENAVEYHDVFLWIVNLIKKYNILPLQIGYDRYSSTYLVQELNAANFHTDDVYQGYNLTPVENELDGLMRDGKLRLGKNNLLKAHFLNMAVKTDEENKRYMPIKIDPRSHIDGAMAVIDALTVRQKYYSQIGSQLKNIRR